MFWNDSIKAQVTALGIGLMIGIIRERTNATEPTFAGMRTHALVALLGSITWALGIVPFTATLLIVGMFAGVSYIRTAKQDPGLTGEVTFVLTFILAAMTHVNLGLAAGLGVLCAILLKAKRSLHRWSRELITDQELGEALLILAAALIVMPLLPVGPIDPWGVIELTNIWRIVVLIMVMGMSGHIARRAFGAKLGLPIAGFFSGFASSTAAIASFGQRVKNDPDLVQLAAASAIMANLASLLLFISIIATVSTELLWVSIYPLTAACLALLLVATVTVMLHRPQNEVIQQSVGSSFKLTHALIIALVISSVSLLSFWINATFGDTGVIIASAVVGLAEIHAAAASLGQLAASSGISMKTAEWAIIAVISGSAVAKIVLAFVSGGKEFGLLVTRGLVLMMVALFGVMLIT